MYVAERKRMVDLQVDLAQRLVYLQGLNMDTVTRAVERVDWQRRRSSMLIDEAAEILRERQRKHYHLAQHGVYDDSGPLGDPDVFVEKNYDCLLQDVKDSHSLHAEVHGLLERYQSEALQTEQVARQHQQRADAAVYTQVGLEEEL